MYNQQGHRPQFWRNHHYYNRKTNQQLEQQIRSELKQQAELMQIEELSKQIENQRNKIISSVPSGKHRNEVLVLLEELILQEKNYVIKKLEQEDKVRKWSDITKHKRGQVDHICNQLKKYEGIVVEMAQLEKQRATQAELKRVEEELENQILSTDPLSFQEDQNESISALAKELQESQEAEKCLVDELTIKRLQETVQKNTLVVEIGKFEDLEREHKEKQQKLNSLQRHLAQIKERVSTMLKQQKLLKKKAKDTSVHTEIQKVSAEHKLLEEQLARVNAQIEKLCLLVDTGHTREELRSLEEEIKELQQREAEVHSQLRQLPNKEEKLEETREQYESAKKYRKKKMQKSDKRLRALQFQIDECRKEVSQLKATREQLLAERENLQVRFQRLRGQKQLPGGLCEEPIGQLANKDPEPVEIETRKEADCEQEARAHRKAGQKEGDNIIIYSGTVMLLLIMILVWFL